MDELEKTIICLWEKGMAAKEISERLELGIDEVINVVVKFGKIEI